MPQPGGGLIPRHLRTVLCELLPDEPVVILTGARTVGKSTLWEVVAQYLGDKLTTVLNHYVRAGEDALRDSVDKLAAM